MQFIPKIPFPFQLTVDEKEISLPLFWIDTDVYERERERKRESGIRDRKGENE